MNYKTKRLKARLSTYTVARELGIDWNTYKDVENGKITLEGEYLDNFLNIIKNAKMINFNRRQKLKDIKEFAEKGKLEELMAKRNYNRMTLAKTLNIEGLAIPNVLKGKHQSDDLNEYVYDFLENPLNAYIENEKPQSENNTTPTNNDNPILEKINKIKKENKFANKDIALEIGVSPSHYAKIISGDRNITPKMKKMIDKFISKYEKPVIEETPIIEEKTEITPVIEEIEAILPITLDDIETIDNEAKNNELEDVKESNISKDYFDLLKENNELKEKLSGAERQIKRYETLIDIIEKLKNDSKNR